ncbi:MAG TPA: ATP-binding protein [Candidatus Omnitrophota bacterium]|nr:ATP-binding protein [Candidatus Omnitrophota bacterium]
MLWPRIGFAKRFIALYGVVFVTVLIITDWTLSQTLSKRNLSQLKQSLTHQALVIRRITAPLLSQQSELQSLIEKIARDTQSRITVVNPEGTVSADSSETPEAIEKMDNHASRPEIAAALRKTTGSFTRYSLTLKTPMLYVAVPILENEKISGVIRVAMPITRVDELLASARKPIIVSALAGVLIVLFTGILFAKHLTQRIKKITWVAEKYAREDWSERILMDGKDELKLLGDTMNLMAETLKVRIKDLENEKGKIAAILNNMTEAVIAIDRRKRLITANPNAEHLFGFYMNQAFGKSLIEITRHPVLELIVDRAIKEQKDITEEIQLSSKTRNILRANVVILGENIQNIGGILVFYDVTELRRLENIRKEFVANVSHELRTPLTSLQGFIETLLGGALKDPKTSEGFLKMMSEDTSRLSRLVDDLLTLNEIEQSNKLISKENLELQKEIQTVLDRFKSQIELKQLVIENKIARIPAISLKAHLDKFRQVLVNLIDNAIKFNEKKGKIILDAKQHPGEIEISIEDTGTGIPQEALPRIFERFFRVDKARSREMGGTGLGLAIVKHIMEAHGGKVTCQSTFHEGSRFSVFFPK